MRPSDSLPFPDPDGPPVGAFSWPPPEYSPRWWLHAVLLAATLITSTFMGAVFYGNLPAEMAQLSFRELLSDPRFIFEGLKFSLPLLTILLCHEMGHYVTARRHGLSVTPPFFLPMPIPFAYSPGTLGAVIRIREPIRRRAQLLDIGVGGPLAGFVVAVPVLVFGLAHSSAAEIPADAGVAWFGEPLLFYALARGVFFPGLPEGWDILLHPSAWAAWWGLFVTALNMLPFSQLDGGHIAYALWGARHRRAVRPMLAVLALMGVGSPVWAFWTAILIFIGPTHPPVADEDAPLDPRRRALGYLAFLVLILSFSFVPIRLLL